MNSNSTEFISEAHNGISAKIVQESGFKGVWASGLTLSAQYGVRDNNEASWTQVLDMVEFMSDATSIPILLDGDTGYGNFNSFRRLVRKLEQIEVGGVCIEDKLFPKTNSFISGEKQELADPIEFAGKIKAGKDTQKDDNFCIIARTEAFIAGWGLKEALRRSEIYMNAGADGILIHSSKSSATEIIEFCKEWANRLPVVIVPTKYYKTPTKVFIESDVKLVIWANHLLRSSIKSMQETSSALFKDKSLLDIELTVSPINEIFRLQNSSELESAETTYLPSKQHVDALILAAGSEENIEAKQESLGKISEVLKTCGISNAICVVNPSMVLKTDYFSVIKTDINITQSEILSLFSGMNEINVTSGNGLLIQYGDLIIPENLLNEFLYSNEKAIKIIGVDFKHSKFPGKTVYDIINLEDSQFDSTLYYLESIATRNASESQRDLLWAGIIFIPSHLIEKVKSYCQILLDLENSRSKPSIVNLIQELIKDNYQIVVELRFGKWIMNENSRETHIL